MDYSLNKRRMAIGAKKGSMMYVASPVCQKQRVSFDKLWVSPKTQLQAYPLKHTIS